MDLNPTDVQRELAESASRWLTARWPAARLVKLATLPAPEPGYDPGDWPALAAQGWLDDDLGVIQLGLLAVESGYALQPAPWLVTMAARPVHEAAGAQPSGPVTVADGECDLTGGPAGVLSGTVTALDAADVVVVPARAGAQLLLAEVRLDGRGVIVTRPDGLDRWRRPAG